MDRAETHMGKRKLGWPGIALIAMAALLALYMLYSRRNELAAFLRRESVELVMLAPPSNIIYPVGYEGEIDVSGMVVKEPKLFFPEEYTLSDLDYTLSTDADFSVPGSYIVTVTVEDEGIKKVFWFTVAVCEGK